MGLILSASAFAQQFTAKGHVKDTSGEDVIGASVRVKGGPEAVITDFEGNFTIQCKKGAILEFSYIGFKTIEAAAAAQMDIVMSDDAHMLENVVVIGYGTAKKNDLTGSVTAIRPDKMNHGLNTNPQDVISGRIAGVNVTSKDGTPGGGAKIRIRGDVSLNASSDPLIVIDGLAMDNNGIKGMSNPLSMVNPNDIESMTVLKDASAAAIYGSRASGGVIIITTKKGQANSGPRFSYAGNVSVSKVKKTVDVLNAAEYRQLIKDTYGEGSAAWNALGNSDTDWQDQIYQSPLSTDHSLTVSGGLKNMPYRVSLGYTNQSGIVKTSKFERYTASVSLSPSFLQDDLKVNANLKAMYAKNRYADGGAIGAAVRMDPTQSVYSDDAKYKTCFGGYWMWALDGNALNDPNWPLVANTNAPTNPVAMLEGENKSAKSQALIGNIELDYRFRNIKDLHIHMNGGMDLSTGKETLNDAVTSTQNNYYGRTGYDKIDKYNLSYNAYAQYGHEWESLFDFNLMAGYEWQHFHNKQFYTHIGHYQASNTVKPGQEYNPSSKEIIHENYLVSWFGRANFKFLDRFLLTATVRRDGSSRFSKATRWETFPSFAFAYDMTKEKFVKNVEIISDMKLRLGYGETGQQGLEDQYWYYYPNYSANQQGAFYPVTGDGSTVRPNAYNTDLKWERTTTYNVGIDFGFFSNRITTSFDWYYRKTKDLISYVQAAAGTNFNTSVYKNIGNMENVGAEFSINARIIDNKNWKWETGFNVAYNDNEITKLLDADREDYYIKTGDNLSTDRYAMANHVGKPINSFYVYQQVYDDNGNPIQNCYVDRNGDGIINSSDKYYYKNASPAATFGFTSKLRYKNWDFSFSLRSSLGNYVYNNVLASNCDISTGSIYRNSCLTNRMPDAVRLNYSNTASEETYLSDHFVQNASFLKCDNITLGYSFNKFFGIYASGRVYATVQNVFTVTKYKGLDPEVQQGIDNNMYPRPLISIVGLNLDF